MDTKQQDPKPILNKILTSDSEAGDIKDWGGQGGYMKIKNKKLKDQFENAETRKSDIFHGVSIWVNGYTNPSSDVLKCLMAEHGGSYQHFFSKTNVTHVIATNLPKSKIKDLKRNDKVVHPNWIVDSVKAGKLLCIDSYLLYSVAKRDGTAIKFCKIKSLNTDKTNSSSIHVDGFSNSEENDERMNLDQRCVQQDVPAEKILAPNLSKHNYSSKSSSKVALKAGDENFISEFYTHSRLHHLAMWKAELKKFTSSIQSKRKQLSSSNLQATNVKKKLIMHVDLDSFFVSVALKKHPELVGKPIAVCHSGRNKQEDKKLAKSFSEIASCSYEARNFGLRNGMMLNRAKELCPHLICVPYYFDEYRNVSEKFYEVLSNFTCDIEAVSCDEALLDVSQLLLSGDSVLGLAENIRTAVLQTTDCVASCGIGNSILIARLATKLAKPNGKYFVSEDEIPQFIAVQKAKDLPGIGWAQGKKLDALNVSTCEDLQRFPLDSLQKEFGLKLGETLYKFCRGEDYRKISLEHERKSVSAEINYGMRFQDANEVEKFIHQLSTEVEKRLKDIKQVGLQITLKLMIRQANASSEPAKYMGHGYCDNLSRSCQLLIPSNDCKTIADKCCAILRSLQVVTQDIRGMGIQVTKLSHARQTIAASLSQFMKPVSTDELHERDKILSIADNESSGLSSALKKNVTNNRTLRLENASLVSSKLPPLPSFEQATSSKEKVESSEKWSQHVQDAASDWDPNVLNELPEDIRKELQAYKVGQKHDISDTISTSKDVSSSRWSPKNKTFKPKNRPKNTKTNPLKFGDVRSSIKRIKFDKTDSKSQKGDMSELGILSPSQVDIDIVNELPEDIRKEIFTSMMKSAPDRINKCFTDLENGETMVLNASKARFISRGHSISPSTFDQSVLKSLPPEIRNDVLNEPNRGNTTNSEARSVRQTNISTSYETPCKTTSILNNERLTTDTDCGNLFFSPSQLDPTVVEALPFTIRQEVIRQAEAVRKRREKRKVESFITVKPIMELPQEIHRNNDNNVDIDVDDDSHSFKIQLTQVLPELCGVSSFTDVKDLLRTWIQEYEEPLSEDTSEILSYCMKLLESFNMETLMDLLRFLRRISTRTQAWIRNFDKILQRVQERIQAMYNGHLPIPRLSFD